MSKTFSTDELVRFIAWSEIDVTDDRCSTIIAKLRAADVLCEAAIAAKGFIELYGGTTERLTKAIAEYEGKA